MVGFRLLAICIVTALAASCAHHSMPALHRTPLFMVDREGASVALVRAELAGRETYLILDTGAEQSVLPFGFVKAAGLRPKKVGESYVDVNGYSTVMQVVPDIPVRFDGETESGPMDFHFGAFLPGGVGVFAPQNLVGSGYVLTMDFVKEELRYDPEDVALQRLRENGGAVEEISWRHCRNEGFGQNAHRVVEIVVNGVATWVLLDTGSARTSLNTDNPAIESMKGMKAKKGEVQGFSAATAETLVVDGIPVTFAGTTLPLRTVLLPSESGAYASRLISCGKGVLGADFLRHCQIVWGSRSLWASCHGA